MRILLMIVMVLSGIEAFGQHPLYVTVNRTLPQGDFKGGWGFSRIEQKEGWNGDKFLPNDEVLDSYGKAFNRTFNNIEALHSFLDGLTLPQDIEKATELTLDLFGPYSVATHDEREAFSLRHTLRVDDDLSRRIYEPVMQSVGQERTLYLLHLAYQFDVNVCKKIYRDLAAGKLKAK